jgi:hypothetical protein
MLKRTAISIKIRLTGKLKVCSVCIQTKSNQKGKKRSIAKISTPLEQVHADLQGIYPVAAIDGTK